MTESLNQEEQKKVSQTHEENPWLELGKTLATALILALGIRQFVAEARYIPSPSMEPTLAINDRLIIEKVSYYFKEPERGDVVVFHPTEKLQEQNYKEDFIKRTIGLPGETVEVNNGRVYINNVPLVETYIAEKPHHNYGPVIVPEGEYLVLGDNRNNSYDSRFWGFVPKEKIVGRAVVRFWPVGRLGNIDPEPLYQSQPQSLKSINFVTYR
jgi:signal peptidase I